MSVLITYHNGATLNPVYAPEHKESIFEFYRNLMANKSVASVVITMDSGEVVAL